MRLLRAAGDTAVSRPLTDLLAVTYGPVPVLTDLIAEVAGVEVALIYGSWAARYRGHPGPVPPDVDLLVVGSADRDDLDDLATRAQGRLGRPVNVRRVRPAAWADSADPFVASVRSQPTVALALAPSDAP